jgi:hypothetical protein
VQDAVTKAIEDANRTYGDFDSMTPFERRWFVNVFPFWAWNRHITQLAARVAIDNPARMLWTLRLGAFASRDEADLPPFLRGSWSTPAGLVSSSFMNPFADVGGGSIFTPEGAARSLNPALKVTAAGAFGVDPNNLFGDVSRPQGTGRIDWYGREVGTPLVTRPWELAYYAAQQLPPTREAIRVLPEGDYLPGDVAAGPVTRFRQGSLMSNRYGRPVDRDARWRTPLRLLGVPVPEFQQEDVEEIQAIRQARLRERARRRD